MAIEIERKFLINVAKWKVAAKDKGTYYKQGYLLIEPGKTIRVRVSDLQGFITIKGPAAGASRPEFEYEIPLADAEELLKKFCLSVISKIRYNIYYLGKQWEVDEFLDENEGLMVAEIELSSEDEAIDLPGWIENEVTGEEKYYNSNLSRNPYKTWKA